MKQFFAFLMIIFLTSLEEIYPEGATEGVTSIQSTISDEYRINEDLLELFLNSHNRRSDRNSTISPWDISIYPNKIYGTDNDCYYFRPPYSNNTIPCISNYYHYIYDIENDVFTRNDERVYYSLFMDNDRGSTLYYINSPEWTLSNIRGDILHLINKNHEEPFPSEERIIEYLLNEFKNTVFDNDYIMETIRQICNYNHRYYEIITRYGLSLLHISTNSDGNGDKTLSRDNYESNSTFYLLNRLNNYFNVNINFTIDNWYNRNIQYMPYVQIYDNGFFFYNSDRVVFFDLAKYEVIEYKFDKNLSEITMGNYEFWIHLSEDNKKFYISIRDFWPDRIYGEMRMYECSL